MGEMPPSILGKGPVHCTTIQSFSALKSHHHMNIHTIVSVRSEILKKLFLFLLNKTRWFFFWDSSGILQAVHVLVSKS